MYRGFSLSTSTLPASVSYAPSTLNLMSHLANAAFAQFSRAIAGSNVHNYWRWQWCSVGFRRDDGWRFLFRFLFSKAAQVRKMPFKNGGYLPFDNFLGGIPRELVEKCRVKFGKEIPARTKRFFYGDSRDALSFFRASRASRDDLWFQQLARKGRLRKCAQSNQV